MRFNFGLPRVHTHVTTVYIFTSVDALIITHSQQRERQETQRVSL